MAELSDELLRNTFFNLRTSVDNKICGDDRKRLQSLCDIALGSRRFSELARPALYHTLNFHLTSLRDMKRILETLCRRPALADLVINLNVPIWETEAGINFGHANLRPPENELVGLYRLTLDRLQPPSDLRRRLEDGLTLGLEDAELAMLIFMCPKLRRLELESDNRLQETLVASVLSELAASSTNDISRSHGTVDTVLSAGHLQQILINHGDTEGVTNISNLSVFLKQPSLLNMRVRMIDCSTQVDLSNVRSTVQRVYMQWSLVSGSGLAQLLMACPAIERLSIQWGPSIVGVSDINYAEIGAALRRYGSGLIHLTLDTKDAFILDGLNGLPLGSLSSLKSLEYLAVPFYSLFGEAEDVESEDTESEDTESEGNESGVHADPRPGTQSELDLVTILPKSLKSLRIHEAYTEEVQDLDLQILGLIQEPTFKNLATIRLAREEPFSFKLHEVSWQCSQSNRFWQVLTKKNEHNDLM